MNSRTGIVTLVGAGPGDPGLITVAGLRALRRADVVIYDRLVSPQLLEQAREDAELIDAGKSPGDHKIKQEEINALIVAHARQGKRVVRLKGGDPFVFGRGYEESVACREMGMPCRVISGVTSAIAGPAAAGIPVTDRQCARSVAFVTGRTAEDLNTEEEAARYRAVAHVDTIVLLMSRGSLDESVGVIIAAGRDPKTPAAAIQSATMPRMCYVRTTLDDIVDGVKSCGMSAPLLIVIGEVAKLHAPQHGGPTGRLTRRTIMLTGPRSSRSLTNMLRRAGATVVSCPLIRISYDIDTAPLDAALRRMPTYAWLAITSQHAAAALGRRFRALQLDARMLGQTRIADVGPDAFRALLRIGLRADFIPQVHSGQAMVEELHAAHPLGGRHVLYPHADSAGSSLAQQLRSQGAIVDEVIAYATLPRIPPAWALAQLEAGVDMIVFSSPSAVRQFAALQLSAGNAKIACIGPTTARAALGSGLNVDLTAARHSGAGLAAALVDYFMQRAMED